MPHTLLIHVIGEEPILAECDDLPDPKDQYLYFSNHRKRDGKGISYVSRGATGFFLPWHRISIVEILGGEEEGAEVAEFFRE